MYERRLRKQQLDTSKEIKAAAAEPSPLAEPTPPQMPTLAAQQQNAPRLAPHSWRSLLGPTAHTCSPGSSSAGSNQTWIRTQGLEVSTAQLPLNTPQLKSAVEEGAHQSVSSLFSAAEGEGPCPESLPWCSCAGRQEQHRSLPP